MFAHKSVDQLSMAGVDKPVKPPACFWPAAVDVLDAVTAVTAIDKAAFRFYPRELLDPADSVCPSNGVPGNARAPTTNLSPRGLEGAKRGANRAGHGAKLCATHAQVAHVRPESMARQRGAER